jgi:putative ABC transport system ATP-binding protein
VIAPVPNQPIVQARELRKSYRQGSLTVPVLRGVTVEIHAGSFAVLLGPSGCGKTTLLNLIGAIDDPDDGELQVAGVDLARATRSAAEAYRRREVGYIFQFYNLLPTLSVRENVELSLEPLGVRPAEASRRANDWLEQMGLSKLAGKFPAQLSGGEQQRVAVARALAKQPRLVIADEPTGSLDRENGRHLVELMKKLNQEHRITFIVVTHDPQLADYASDVFRMEDGRIVSAGSAARGAGAGHSLPEQDREQRPAPTSRARP